MLETARFLAPPKALPCSNRFNLQVKQRQSVPQGINFPVTQSRDKLQDRLLLQKRLSSVTKGGSRILVGPSIRLEKYKR